MHQSLHTTFFSLLLKETQQMTKWRKKPDLYTWTIFLLLLEWFCCCFASWVDGGSLRRWNQESEKGIYNEVGEDGNDVSEEAKK